MKKVEYGVGVEAEGFVLDGNGGAVNYIEGMPTIAYVQKIIAAKYPQLVENISAELAAFIVEVKSDVFKNGPEAIKQILEVRAMIDRILAPSGAKLVFTPVMDRPYEFVPSSDDMNSRPAQLFEQWGNHPEGRQNLLATTINSFQINDSRPFAGVELEGEKLDIARKIHNLMGDAYGELVGQNVEKRDYRGQTRVEYYLDFITRMKGPKFVEAGFARKLDAVIPPYFHSVEAMKKWMMVHSGVVKFEDSSCKNEHAITAKIKRGEYDAVETRIFDAVNSEEEMLKRLKFNEKLLKPYLK